jgi:phosphoribosylcarboxyaminoimidazole (NCAIR) mutase
VAVAVVKVQQDKVLVTQTQLVLAVLVLNGLTEHFMAVAVAVVPMPQAVMVAVAQVLLAAAVALMALQILAAAVELQIMGQHLEQVVQVLLLSATQFQRKENLNGTFCKSC